MFITKMGLEALEKQLNELKEELDRTSRERGEAAREGDLKENSAYIFLGERADVLRTQIGKLSQDLKEAEVKSAPIQSDIIEFGHQVTVNFENDNRQMTITLVGEHDAPLKPDWISLESPIGQALLGKKVGDKIEVNGQPVTITHISIGDIEN